MRSGLQLHVRGVLSPLQASVQQLAPFLGHVPSIEQQFVVPLHWDGTMLRGLIHDGFTTNVVGLVPIG